MRNLININNIKWTCHHLHLDKSKTMNRDILEKSFVHMKDKWKLIRDIKKNYTMDDLKKRMFSTSMSLKKQGCYKMRTFIDVDHIVGLKPLYAALEIKHILDKQGIELQLGTQLLEGLESKESIELFEKAAPLVDFIGCLPSRDKNKEKHLDIVFNKATELNKDIEAHLDQCNIPQEKETELFCDFVEKYNYNGKSRAIHSISLACQPIEYQKKIAKRLKKLDIGVIICPSAAISMKQHSEYTAPVHNSIAPIDILLEEGVNIGLGVDNIEDIFVPYCDGNMEFELRMLAEAGRIYDPNTLINIAENKMGFT